MKLPYIQSKTNITFCYKFSGEEFHYQLENEFTFIDEMSSSRGSCTKRVLKLPPRIPPRSVLKVRFLFLLRAMKASIDLKQNQ